VKRFAALYAELDATRSTDRKVAALEAYLREAPPGDAAWGLWLLSGNRLKRTVAVRKLADWALELTGLAPWLLEASYVATGDLAETIALLVDAGRRPEEQELGTAPSERAHWRPEDARPDRALVESERRAPQGTRGRPGSEAPSEVDLGLAAWIARVQALPALEESERAARVLAWWRGLEPLELLVFVKLLTGELRVGVSRTLVERALARVLGVDPLTVAERLAGTWEPSATFFTTLCAGGDLHAPLRPYPFMLAAPLEAGASPEATLGPLEGWLAEWKWDGIRAQLLVRGRKVAIWSRGEELITDRFPEVVRAAEGLEDGTVLDGELLIAHGERALPFSVLQRRIGRTKLTPKLLRDTPAALFAFDCLARAGEDLRERPLEARRAALVEVVGALGSASAIRLAPLPPAAATWAEAGQRREEARERGVEGLILKRRDAPYRGGRKRDAWWKWKLDPYTFDAVLVAAEPGHGRRASLHTDLTFALWDEGALVTVAKAYSGLTDEELRAVDRWVRANTDEQFGPVRTVKPHHVFELACEGVQRSSRHRSGVAVRFPRIARWRTDKRPPEADTLDVLRAWLPPEPPPPKPEDLPLGQLPLFPSR